MSSKKVEHLIVDSGAFIRGAPIHELGENIYTIEEVINEIKDKATRERLERMPYPIKFVEPSTDSIKFVTLFSKKTGDYPWLSATDLKLMGLVHHLEKQHNGTDHLRTEPLRAKVKETGAIKELLRPTPGFYVPGTQEDKGWEDVLEGPQEEKDEELSDDDVYYDCPSEINQDVNPDSESANNRHQERSQKGSAEASNSHEDDSDTGSASDDEGQSDQDAYEEHDDDHDDGDADDDEDGWIGPNNLDTVINKMRQVKVDDPDDIENIKVACLTTDYAMQNVLIQIGLKCVSIDGYSIRQTKQFILRCYACFQTTTDMRRKFCRGCGNHKTLKRVGVTVNANGERILHINYKKPIVTRGLKHHLPRPKGGKHARNPILVEDQRRPQHRPSKFAVKQKAAVAGLKVLTDPNYVIRDSPFPINDVHSRASRFKEARRALRR